MPVPLYGCAAGTNKLVRLDDTSISADEGAAMTIQFVTGDFDMGPAGGEGRFRRFIQAVRLAGAQTIVCTPIVNGAESPSQAQTFNLVTTAGAEQRIEFRPSSMGTRHAVKVAVTSLGGALAFGEADVFLIPRRGTEHA